MARVALVTGGTRGIGAAIAKKLKEAGYKAVVCDVVEDQLKAFTAETGIPGYGLYDRALGVLYLRGLWEGVGGNDEG